MHNTHNLLYSRSAPPVFFFSYLIMTMARRSVHWRRRLENYHLVGKLLGIRKETFITTTEKLGMVFFSSLTVLQDICNVYFLQAHAMGIPELGRSKTESEIARTSSAAEEDGSPCPEAGSQIQEPSSQTQAETRDHEANLVRHQETRHEEQSSQACCIGEGGERSSTKVLEERRERARAGRRRRSPSGSRHAENAAARRRISDCGSISFGGL